MNWVQALSWLAVALIGVCIWVLIYAAHKGRRRPNRVRNSRVTEHRITVSMPASWLKDFARRDYGKTDPK